MARATYGARTVRLASFPFHTASSNDDTKNEVNEAEKRSAYNSADENGTEGTRWRPDRLEGRCAQ